MNFGRLVVTWTVHVGSSIKLNGVPIRDGSILLFWDMVDSLISNEPGNPVTKIWRDFVSAVFADVESDFGDDFL